MLAPAKLNLALHVTGQRTDGYHLLQSLVAFCDIGDSVTVGPSERNRLTVDGPFAGDVPPLSDNMLGAALNLVRAWGEAPDPVHIHLTKSLPAASGIGGGSADAAALIAALTGNRHLSSSQMADCLSLGADVPMCVVGEAAIVGGIGEHIEPIQLPSAHLVLVNLGVAVPTPAVFKALVNKSNPVLPTWAKPTTFDGLVQYLAGTRNDLMAPAIGLVPKIEDCLAELEEAPFARMSGSGATCFGLLETASAASALARRIQAKHPSWWVRAGKLL